MLAGQGLMTTYKSLTGMTAKRCPHVWKSTAYYQQSKKDVILEVKFARISL